MSPSYYCQLPLLHWFQNCPRGPQVEPSMSIPSPNKIFLIHNNFLLFLLSSSSPPNIFLLQIFSFSVFLFPQLTKYYPSSNWISEDRLHANTILFFHNFITFTFQLIVGRSQFSALSHSDLRKHLVCHTGKKPLFSEVQSQHMAFTRSPSSSNNPKILNNYLICSVDHLYM